MKSRNLNSLYGAALISAFALVIAAFQMNVTWARAEKAGERAESKSQGGTLEGTWRVEVTRRDCQTGAEIMPSAPPAPAFLTFGRGGTLTETTTVFPPALRGPGHGFWRHTGGQTYTAVSEAFIFNPSAPPAAAWIGTQRITQTIKIGDDPDELTSTASTVFFGPGGNPIPGFPPVPVCATAVARRME
jgi:hypothetical protein